MANGPIIRFPGRRRRPPPNRDLSDMVPRRAHLADESQRTFWGHPFVKTAAALIAIVAFVVAILICAAAFGDQVAALRQAGAL